MSYFRSLSATLLSAASTFSLVTASSCGTSAVGIDDCRDIEQARCRASASCLDDSGAPRIQDVPACERYYRDHCLHGFAVKPPPGASVAGCIQVIEAAGRCAKGDPSSPLGCTETATRPVEGFRTACDLVAQPHRAAECVFLTDTPDVNDGAAGQSGGGQSSTSGTSTGASSGQAGETAQAGASLE